MKIYCNNVRVWTRDKDKTSDWFWKKRMKAQRELISEQDPDVLCLQELSFPANLYLPKGYRRVGLTASHPIYVKRGIKTRRHRFHIHYDSCEIGSLTLVNVHLHWNRKILERNMERIARIVRRAKGQVIICGDFNNSSWKVADLIDPLLRIVSTASETFRNSSTGSEGWIDYFVLNGTFKGICNLGFEYEGQTLSDHTPLLLEI